MSISELEPADKTVFVTGAGFSKAFNPKAPLMVGFLKEHQALLKDRQYRPVREFIRRCGMRPSTLNIETLFTFSAMSKPWLSIREAAESELVTALLTRLIRDVIYWSFKVENQKDGRWLLELNDDNRRAIENCARFMLDYNVHVITFNYDVLLENYVNAEQERRVSEGESEHRCQFDIGYSYGFPCLIQRDGRIVRSDKAFPEIGMQFLKLHGSLLWFAASGAGTNPSYREVLAMPVHTRATPLRHYDLMFERQPLIVPPILDKASSLTSPVLNLVWARAAKLVSLAETIVFLGYSLPPTDYYADFLFRHVPPGAKVIVVDFVDPSRPERERRAKQGAIKQRYRAIFGRRRKDLPYLQRQIDFHFNGAVDFCGKLGQDFFRDR